MIKEGTIKTRKDLTYFNGASQGEPQIGAIGGILQILDTHYISFRVEIGQGTNNLAEFGI